MNDFEIEARVRTSMEHATPDLLDGILSRCGEIPQGTSKKEKVRRPLPFFRMAMTAAAFFLVVTAVFAGNQILAGRVDSVVFLDVNPSIELDLNASERVVEVKANNEEGKLALDGMDLHGVQLEVAVNAIIGSLVRHEYLQPDTNSVLVSVKNKNEEKSIALERKLSGEIGVLLQQNHIDGAILSQTISGDKALQAQAEQYGISPGKASLISKLIEKNPLLRFEEMVGLTVNDLNLLASAKKTALSDVESVGNASDKAYIGEAKARDIALQEAGVTQSEISRLEMEMDCEIGRMVYDVSFVAAGIEYSYEIQASDGTVLSREQEQDDGEYDSDDMLADSVPAEDRIGLEKAREIALNDAGLAGKAREVDAELDSYNGVLAYEVDFQFEHREYTYFIDAVTGEILHKTSEYDD